MWACWTAVRVKRHIGFVAEPALSRRWSVLRARGGMPTIGTSCASHHDSRLHRTDSPPGGGLRVWPGRAKIGGDREACTGVVDNQVSLKTLSGPNPDSVGCDFAALLLARSLLFAGR